MSDPRTHDIGHEFEAAVRRAGGGGMSDHTPGEWEVATAIVGGRVMEHFIRRPGDDTAIASDIIDPETDQPSAANARLIAAAPDLLAAAVSAEEILYHTLIGGECEDDCECILHDLRLAIAKARGEQP